MAYSNPDHYAEYVRPLFPRVIPRLMGERTLAPIGGAPVLPRLTPLGFDTNLGKFVPWANANIHGANAVSAFLWTDDLDVGLQTDAANDTLCTVILKGEIHHDDIPLPTGETQNNLDAALRSGPRSLGLEIRGLDAVR